MAKSAKKKTAKKTKVTRKAKAKKGKTKVTESLDCLLELHKLQGILLAQLKKEL